MTPTSLHLRFRTGDLRDFVALAHHHYHPTPPATCVLVLTACAGAEAVGVLVLSMPVLNAAWRDLAFPADPNIPGARPRYRSGDRRADARRLNAEVRTISRVVVEPRYRGLGIGAALVRRYLRRPLTPVTEAVAAMGLFSGIFRAAGMTEYRLEPSPRDRRLGDALAALGLEPWQLADARRLAPVVRRSPLLARELRRWAQASRATRGILRRESSSLLLRAARIMQPPIVYVAVHHLGGAGGIHAEPHD